MKVKTTMHSSRLRNAPFAQDELSWRNALGGVSFHAVDGRAIIEESG